MASLPPFPPPKRFIRVTFETMNIAQAKSIPIGSYLESQGHRPDKTRQGGRELWFHSPIRDGDQTPSFKVDTVKNIWYDHGAAMGGTIIDLVTAQYACSVRDALRHLEKTGLGLHPRQFQGSCKSPSSAAESPLSASPYSGLPTLQQALPSTLESPHSGAQGANRERAAGQKEKNSAESAVNPERKTAFELIASRLITHPALLQYLTQRGIDHDVARRYLSEIDFKGPQSAGIYFALGYPAGDGFEVRNARFKGFVGTGKAVSFHDKPEATRLQIFEGFMDLLSYLSADQPAQPVGAVLVLNSTNLWQRALSYINDPRFSEVRLYLDNDAAGDAATRNLFERAQTPSKLADMRGYYQGYEDLNDWLMGSRP